MSGTLTIIASIFGLIGLGYAARRSGVLAREIGEGLTEFVFKVAIPCLLFETLATADLHGLSPWRVWVAYFAPFAIVWTLSHLMIRRVFGRDTRAGVVAGGSAAYANSVLIGIPLIGAAFGEGGAVYLITIVSIHLPTMMLASVLLNEWAVAADGLEPGAAGRAQVVRRVSLALLRHPILLAIAAGLAWRVAGLPLPTLFAAILQPLGSAAGPLALFASGMALAQYGVARQVAPAVAVSALKLLAMPALVYAAATLVGLPPVGRAAVTLTAACPTGVNAYLIASQLGTGEALASNTLLISTAAGLLTVLLWLEFLLSTLA